VQIFGQFGPNFGAVNVAIDSAEWLEAFQLAEKFGSSEIACVPELIAFGEVAKDGIVEEAVGIGEKTDSQGSWYRRATIYCVGEDWYRVAVDRAYRGNWIAVSP